MVRAVLLTGYGKSLIFHLQSSFIGERNRRSEVLKNRVILYSSPELADKRPATKDKSRAPKGGCIKRET